MADLNDTMYGLLDSLDKEQMNRFKEYLRTELLGCKPMLKRKLEDTDVTDTVRLMKEHYGTKKLLDVTVIILKKICRQDLIDGLQIPMGWVIATGFTSAFSR